MSERSGPATEYKTISVRWPAHDWRKAMAEHGSFVESEMALGWIPFGGVSILMTREAFMVSQAMVR